MNAAVSPMSSTVVSVICLTSDSTNGSIVGRVYHRGPAPPGPRGTAASAPRGPRGLDPRLSVGILVEGDEAVEQPELLARQRAPAVLVVELDEREVQADVVRREREPLVARVDRRVPRPVEPVRRGEVEQAV